MAQICAGLMHMHTHDPPYAHNDMKPGNVLLSLPRNHPPNAVIMDFGSARPARRKIENRKQALTVQVQSHYHGAYYEHKHIRKGADCVCLCRNGPRNIARLHIAHLSFGTLLASVFLMSGPTFGLLGALFMLLCMYLSLSLSLSLMQVSTPNSSLAIVVLSSSWLIFMRVYAKQRPPP